MLSFTRTYLSAAVGAAMLPCKKKSFECLTLTETRPTPVKLSQFELLIIQPRVAVHERAVGSEREKWFYCGYWIWCNHWPLLQPQIYSECERKRLLTIILFMIPSKWALGWSRSQVLTSLLSVGFHSLADCVLNTETFQSVLKSPFTLIWKRKG